MRSKWLLLGVAAGIVLGCFNIPAGAEQAPDATNLPELARELAVAQAQAAQTRAWVGQARRAVPSVYQARKEYERSPEYQQALRELAAARSTYNDARQRVLEAVAKDPHYQVALSMRDDFEKRIKEGRGRIAQRTLQFLAERKMHYAAEVSRMEEAALQQDSVAQVAKRRMLKAYLRFRDIKSRFEPMEDSPSYMAAVEQLRGAQEQHVQAMWRLAGAEAAYGQAVQPQEGFQRRRGDAPRSLRTPDRDWRNYRFGSWPLFVYGFDPDRVFGL